MRLGGILQQEQLFAMIKIRPEPIEEEDDGAFSGTKEQEVMFLLVPVRTYRKCEERARIDGCTAAQVFERALLQYLRGDKDEVVDSSINRESQRDEPKADFIMRRKRK